MYANTYIWNLKKKKGFEKPKGRTGIKTQTWRVDLRTRVVGGVGCDEVRDWHGPIYTTKPIIDS